MVCLLLEVRMLKRFFIQSVVRKKKRLKLLECIIKLMEILALVSKGTENTIGLLIKILIDLAMVNKDSLMELQCQSIMRDLMVDFQKLSL